MADEADIAKANEDDILDRRIKAAQQTDVDPGTLLCVDCRDVIPEAHRLANPRARRCIDCQEHREEGMSV